MKIVFKFVNGLSKGLISSTVQLWASKIVLLSDVQS